MSHDTEHYLARRLEDDSFQFSPESELNAARAELSRSYMLKGFLQELSSKHPDLLELKGGYQSYSYYRLSSDDTVNRVIHTRLVHCFSEGTRNCTRSPCMPTQAIDPIRRHPKVNIANAGCDLALFLH